MKRKYTQANGENLTGDGADKKKHLGVDTRKNLTCGASQKSTDKDHCEWCGWGEGEGVVGWGLEEKEFRDWWNFIWFSCGGSLKVYN